MDFQLRVLKLIEEGYSPQVLSKKLNIPVQTYYHWRRRFKNTPKKNLNFIELPVSDKLNDSSVDKKEVIHMISSKGFQFSVDLDQFSFLLEKGLL